MRLAWRLGLAALWAVAGDELARGGLTLDESDQVRVVALLDGDEGGLGVAHGLERMAVTAGAQSCAEWQWVRRSA